MLLLRYSKHYCLEEIAWPNSIQFIYGLHSLLQSLYEIYIKTYVKQLIVLDCTLQSDKSPKSSLHTSHSDDDGYRYMLCERNARNFYCLENFEVRRTIEIYMCRYQLPFLAKFWYSAQSWLTTTVIAFFTLGIFFDVFHT